MPRAPDRPADARPPDVRPAGRIAFANQLRGAAALCVAASHLIGVYWAIPAYVALATFSPVQPGPRPSLYALVDSRWFRLGPFGVGLFFLISGLVIPFSLARHTRVSFLAARALRIYPLFVLALLIELGVLYGAARWWHRPFTYDAGTIAANFLLVNNLIGRPPIDFVNWTLTIELEFYVLVVLLAGVIRRARTAPLIGAGFALAAVAAVLGRHPTAPLAAAFGFESRYLVFMLIGVLFNFHDRGQLATSRLIPAIGVMILMFAAAVSFGVAQSEYRVVAGNYVAALLVFGSLYAVRHRIGRNRVLDFMASISFPVYLIHAVIGFSVMKYLMLDWRLSYKVALGAAAGLIVGIAILLHLTVELRTIALGHALAKGGPVRRLRHGFLKTL